MDIDSQINTVHSTMKLKIVFGDNIEKSELLDMLETIKVYQQTIHSAKVRIEEKIKKLQNTKPTNNEGD